MKNLKMYLISIKLFILYKYYSIKRKLIKPKIPKNKDGKIFLNLGCGLKSGPEYVNIDTLILPNIHYIQDIQKLYNFPNESVDLIYASHVVEHIPRNNLIDVLMEWKRVLKKGGIFRISVPDFDKLIEFYKLSDNNVESIMSQVLGADGEYDDHHTLWNYKHAKKILESIGYKNIKIWDPKNVKEQTFKDRSSRTLKSEKGNVFISLNIQCEK